MNEAPTQPIRPAQAEVKPVGRVEQAKATVKEWSEKGKQWFKDQWGKITNKPREVLEEVNNISVPSKREDLYLVDSTEKTNTFPKIPEYQKENFRPIEKGESFEGGMLILEREERTHYNQQVEDLYGGEGKGNGKWGTVFLSGEKATKILINQITF